MDTNDQAAGADEAARKAAEHDAAVAAAEEAKQAAEADEAAAAQAGADEAARAEAERKQAEADVAALKPIDPSAPVSFVPQATFSVCWNSHLVHFRKDELFINAEPGLMALIIDAKAPIKVT